MGIWTAVKATFVGLPLALPVVWAANAFENRLGGHARIVVALVIALSVSVCLRQRHDRWWLRSAFLVGTMVLGFSVFGHLTVWVVTGSGSHSSAQAGGTLEASIAAT